MVACSSETRTPAGRLATGETGAGLDAGGGATCSELPVKTGVRKTEGSLEVQRGIGLMILGQWTHKMK